VSWPPRASDDASSPVRLTGCPDPAAALMGAYRRGGLVSVSTAGSTGPSRRVIRTAASWVDSFTAVAQLIELGDRSRAFIPGPIQATMNLYALTLAGWSGAEVVDGVADATHAFVTPAELHVMLEEASASTDRVRSFHVVAAGDRLSAAMADRAEAVGWTVSHYYGAAQLSFVAWGRDAESLRPFPAVEVRSDSGLLWVESPWVCVAEEVPQGQTPVLRSRVHGSRRWWTVGDRGHVDDAGFVRVAGREQAVTTGGATVQVADVEAALRPHAGGDVYVVGVPHPVLGEVVAAVCADRRDLTRLPAVARALLAGTHRPRRWVHLAAPPLTRAGKVDRTELSAWVARQRRGQVP
jgi:long-chain acyl-CoA synthetase